MTEGQWAVELLSAFLVLLGGALAWGVWLDWTATGVLG